MQLRQLLEQADKRAEGARIALAVGRVAAAVRSLPEALLELPHFLIEGIHQPASQRLRGGRPRPGRRTERPAALADKLIKRVAGDAVGEAKLGKRERLVAIITLDGVPTRRIGREMVVLQTFLSGVEWFGRQKAGVAEASSAFTA